MQEGLQFKNSEGTETYSTVGKICCTSQNLIYGIYCDDCQKVVYVGETKQTLYARHLKNFSRIRTSNLDDVTGHFTSQNHHSLDNYKIFGI